MSPEQLFKEEIARSNSTEIETLMTHYHQIAFPRLIDSTKVSDIPTQMMGIDRYLTVGNRTISVEEKVDYFHDRQNICFEVKQSPHTEGWSMSKVHADILLYSFYHQRTGFYFNATTLLQWFRMNSDTLSRSGYPFLYTHNGAKVQPLPITLVRKHVEPLKCVVLP